MGIVLTLKVYMNKDKRSVEERIFDAGFDNVIVLKDFSYDGALIGVSEDNRAIYNFDLMVEWLMSTEDFDEIEAIEWIEHNTIRALPYMGSESPIIMYPVK